MHGTGFINSKIENAVMIHKCCMIICEDSYDQAIFITAMHHVSPNTICYSAQNPADALLIIRDEALTPDLIFIDHQMPGMDAIDFLRLSRSMAALRETSIIVHAPLVKPHILRKLKELGALAIYQRPYAYHGVCNVLTIFLEDELGVTIQN